MALLSDLESHTGSALACDSDVICRTISSCGRIMRGQTRKAAGLCACGSHSMGCRCDTSFLGKHYALSLSLVANVTLVVAFFLHQAPACTKPQSAVKQRLGNCAKSQGSHKEFPFSCSVSLDCGPCCMLQTGCVPVPKLFVYLVRLTIPKVLNQRALLL